MTATAPSPTRTREALALTVREHIIRMATDGGCFLGASLSCTDLIVHLYTSVLQLSPQRLADPDRDVLLLSKGHDVPALYGTLAELGYLDPARLANHLKPHDHIYWHPNRKVPGVEFHSGSLGHLLSVGMGIAYDARMRKSPARTFVIVGDGECNEGSMWEGLLVAHAHKLDNLVVIVDRNEFQANVRTELLVPLEPMEEKFRAFGAAVHRCDGHDFAALDRAFARLPLEAGKPTVVIADTVRGKGLPSIEARADRWFCNFTAAEVQSLLKELHGEAAATVQSETLIVR